ncbi:hypothetical protein HP568_11320 [Brevibacillus sp. MS2.2]|nr:hypothetical protein [Brevibacillus sp. MS2.2]
MTQPPLTQQIQSLGEELGKGKRGRLP